MTATGDKSLVELLHRHIETLRRVKPSYGNLFFAAAPTRSLIVQVFGKDSDVARDFNDLVERAKGSPDAPEEKEAILAFLERLLSRLTGEPQGGTGPPKLVFIGHGRSYAWREIEGFLTSELGLSVEAFETESRTSEHVVGILSDFLVRCDTAVLVLTPDDLTAEGSGRARQNVIHEVGLFQGRLGFDRVVVVEQEGVEGFSNIAGLQTIRFKERPEEAFYALGRFFSRLSRLQ